MRNRLIAALAGLVVVGGLVAYNLVRVKRPAVVIFTLLSHPILDDSIAGIRDGLAEAGYDEAAIDLRVVNANGDMSTLDAIAREILAGKPQVLVSVSTPVTQAVVKEAPIDQALVFSTVTNPGDVGMDKHPKNLTGVSDAVNFRRNVDLVRQLFPAARRIGMVYNAGERNSQFGVEEVRRLTVEYHLDLDLVAVSNSNEVADAARTLAGRVDVFYVGSDNTVVGSIEALLKVAAERRIPVIASDAGSVEKGALAAVSVDYTALGRSVATLVARILRDGALPGHIRNVIFEGDQLLLNQKTARQMGYTFPPALITTAAKVVE